MEESGGDACLDGNVLCADRNLADKLHGYPNPACGLSGGGATRCEKVDDAYSCAVLRDRTTGWLASSRLCRGPHLRLSRASSGR
jgi:hypothetical protein